MAAEVKARRGVTRISRKNRGVTRVSRKNQVTLPVAALRQAHVKPGDELHVIVDEQGRLVLVPVKDPLEALIGSMPGVSAAADLDALRNEWAQ